MCLAEYELGKFDFIVGMVIWYHILAKVNLVSKQLQSANMLIDGAMDNVKIKVVPTNNCSNFIPPSNSFTLENNTHLLLH